MIDAKLEKMCRAEKKINNNKNKNKNKNKKIIKISRNKN